MSQQPSSTPLGDEALAAKPIQPGEAVDLCNRVAAALNLAPGNAFQDRDAWEKLARTLAQRFDTFEEVSVWRLRAEEVGELGTRAPRSETAAPEVDYVKLGAGIVLDPVPDDKPGEAQEIISYLNECIEQQQGDFPLSRVRVSKLVVDDIIKLLSAVPSAELPLIKALEAIRDLPYYGNSSFHPRVIKLAADALEGYRAPQSAIGALTPLERFALDPLVAACRGLISYWTRNIRNFQWEKADEHVKRINIALGEMPAARAAFMPPTKYRALIVESVAQQLEVLPLTYAGPDPQGVKNLRDLMVMAIRDMKNATDSRTVPE